MSENSGGDVNYYRVEVTHPKRTEPYVAECEDIIAALGMDFFEGEAFKAAWRKAAQRTLGVGKEGNTALRDAQKMAHYGARCLAIEGYRLTYSAPEVPVAECPLPPEEWGVGALLRYIGHATDVHSTGQHYKVLGFRSGGGSVWISNDGTAPTWFERRFAEANFTTD